VAVDSSGDLFWTQLQDGTVDERTAGGSSVVLASGFLPTGVAVDGSGDVFFGSFGSGSNAAGLYEIPNGGSATLLTARFGEISSLAVDGNGDIWGASGSDSLVVVPPGTAGEAISIPGGSFNGVRLDGADNIFASTAFGDDAIEVPAGGVSPTVVGNIGSYSQGVAVDGSGNVFVGASATSYPNGKVYKIPSGGSPGVYASPVATTGGLALYPALSPAGRSGSTIALTTTSSSNVTTESSVKVTATVPSGETGGIQFDDNGYPIGDATTTSGGTATITTHLSAGSHDITAVYLGDSAHAPALSNTLSFTSTAIASKTVLSFPSGTTLPGDQQLTVDAHVSGRGGTPTGSVTFYDGTTQVGSGNLDSNGDTSVSFYAAPGTSSVHATYSGDPIFKASNSAKTQVTTVAPYLATLRTSVKYGTPSSTNGSVKATINVTVLGVKGQPAPTGSVTADQGFTCGALTTVTGTNRATASCTNRLPAGTSDDVTITFTSGDGNYASATTDVFVENFGGD
jgi:hypothetical protein